MNTCRLASLLLLSCWAASAAEPSAGAAAKAATRIIDGDTLVLLTTAQEELKVRLHGIDAPEKKQPYSQAAKEHLGKLVEGKEVRIEVTGRGRWGRTIAWVYADDVNVNHTLVAAGLAWWFRVYAPDDEELERLEEEAREARKGLWVEPGAVAPWEFRARKKTQGD